MVGFRVVLDACVMLPQTLNNLLLTLADAELFVPVWTPDLLEEVERNLTGSRFGKTPEQAKQRVLRMRTAFPFAEEFSSGYRELISSMVNDPKDRHVLAAAVRSGAGLIVTANLKDFPRSALEKFDVEAIHPDEFLCDLLDLHTGIVFECMEVVVTRNAHPPRTVGELLVSLERQVPRFVDAVRRHLIAPDEPSGESMGAADLAPHEFVELDDEQLKTLSPDAREAYERLRTMDHAERVRFLGHVKLVEAAWAFLSPVCVDGDLRSVWPNVHPDLRLALTQQWVRDNQRSIEADGFDEQAVAEALSNATPEHPLWVHFERVHVRFLRELVPPPATWGIGASTRLVGPDLEVLYVHDTSTLEDGVWEPNTPRHVFPILMNLVEGRWLVRNLGPEADPTGAI